MQGQGYTKSRVWSRRRLISLAGMTPVVGVFAADWAQAHPQEQPVPVPPTLPIPPVPAEPEPELDTSTLAAGTDAEQHMTIEVMLNGKGPYHFVVDTGSEKSVISDRVAAELGLITSGEVRVTGIARKVSANLVRVREMAFGPIVRNDLNLPVLPWTDLLADGFLGLDAIRGCRVTFDFRKKVLRIEHPRSTVPFDESGRQTIVVRATGNSGRLKTTDCTVDGIGTTMFLDTGAQLSIGNPALRDALLRRNRNLAPAGTIDIFGITGGQIAGVAYPIKAIRVHSLMFGTGVVAIADVSIFNDWGLANRPALMLGMDFLRQFGGVSIDYRRKEILFEMSGLIDNGPSPVGTPVKPLEG
jgi:predicted aspartyl protease